MVAYSICVHNGICEFRVPVLRPSKFELVANLKTAKTLGGAVRLETSIAINFI